jgi:hypothetical protein
MSIPPIRSGSVTLFGNGVIKDDIQQLKEAEQSCRDALERVKRNNAKIVKLESEILKSEKRAISIQKKILRKDREIKEIYNVKVIEKPSALSSLMKKVSSTLIAIRDCFESLIKKITQSFSQTK